MICTNDRITVRFDPKRWTFRWNDRINFARWSRDRASFDATNIHDGDGIAIIIQRKRRLILSSIPDTASDLCSRTEFWTRSSGHSGRTIKSEKRGAFYSSGRHSVLSVLRASRKLRENSVYGQRAARTKSTACLADAYPWCVHKVLDSGLPVTSLKETTDERNAVHAKHVRIYTLRKEVQINVPSTENW